MVSTFGRKKLKASLRFVGPQMDPFTHDIFPFNVSSIVHVYIHPDAPHPGSPGPGLIYNVRK